MFPDVFCKFLTLKTFNIQIALDSPSLAIKSQKKLKTLVVISQCLQTMKLWTHYVFMFILLPLVPVVCALFQETPALFGSYKIKDINYTPWKLLLFKKHFACFNSCSLDVCYLLSCQLGAAFQMARWPLLL